MVKTIGIFLGKIDLQAYFNTTPYYLQGYLELSQAIQEQGGQMVLLSDQESYKGNGVFTRHLLFQNHHLKAAGEIRVDVIYNKGGFVTDRKVTLFNSSFVNDICIDKWKTYTYFKQYCPETFLINNEKELIDILPQIKTSHVVTKPVDGGEGKDVAILSKEHTLKRAHNFPLLVQEFLNSSQGIPDIMQGIHDLRIAVLNGEIMYSYYRTPPKGKLIANWSLGGEYAMIPNENIPKEAIKVVKAVDKVLSIAPDRYYSVDLAFTPKGVKIIELNSRVGLSIYADGDVFKTFNQKFAKVLMNLD